MCNITLQRILALLFIVAWFVVFNACNSSEFSGNNGAKSKKSGNTTNNQVEVDTNSHQPTVNPGDEIIDSPSDETSVNEKICFEPPELLPAEVKDMKLLYNWIADPPNEVNSHVETEVVVGHLVDEIPSIVAQGGTGFNSLKNVYAVNGATRKQLWVSTVKTRKNIPAIGDIDQDGIGEVVVYGQDGELHTLDGRDGHIKWTSSEKCEVTYQYSAVLDIGINIADVDEDGEVEVVACQHVFAGKTGQKKYSIAETISGSATPTVVGEVNSKPGREIISVNGIFDGRNGHKICSFAWQMYAWISFAKLRKDDSYMTIVGVGVANNVIGGPSLNNFPGPIVAFNGETCEQLFSVSPAGVHSTTTIADFDGDGDLEIALAGFPEVVALKPTGEILWKVPVTANYSGGHGITAFDFNGDGKYELVSNDLQYLRMIDATTGQVFYQTPNSAMQAGGGIVADVNNDGHAEIIVQNSGAKGFNVYGSPENNWIGTRPIWNQTDYYVTNVGDKSQGADFNAGAIWKKWISAEYLIGFRTNLPLRPLKEKCD